MQTDSAGQTLAAHGCAMTVCGLQSTVCRALVLVCTGCTSTISYSPRQQARRRLMNRTSTMMYTKQKRENGGKNAECVSAVLPVLEKCAAAQRVSTHAPLPHLSLHDMFQPNRCKTDKRIGAFCTDLLLPGTSIPRKKSKNHTHADDL